jgi:enoyl-CoA hydratase/carnithine racemase
MPTVAFVTGGCIEAGVFLAMACDYRIQDPSSGVICLPYVDRGIPVPTSIAAVLRAKMPSLLVYRDAVIGGR